MAVEVDGDVLEGLEGTDDAFDADPGGLLEVAGDGQCGHDHGQVRLDSIALVAEDGAGWQVVVTHRRKTAPRATARDRRRPPHRHPSDARECW